MYLCRIFIATIIGLVWYFSDCGRVATQLFLCVVFWPSTLNVFVKTRLESGTQTDDVAEDKSLQETVEEEHVGFSQADVTCNTLAPSEDPPCPSVKKSLQQVFECAYAQLVLPWYCVPEPCERQPLHQAMWGEFDQVIDRVISRGRDFDVSTGILGCVRILTQHLNNAKQSGREPLFRSRGEEVAVLRVFSKALVQNFLPQSLWGLAVSHCILNEIVALKVLELLVTWLSDPDNLNQLVVSQLDVVSPKSSVDDLSESESDRSSLERQASGANLEKTEDTQINEGKSKKKANKLTEGWSKFLHKIKPKRSKKKLKEKEQTLLFRAMSFNSNLSDQDEGRSQEASTYSQQESNNEDCSLEAYLSSVQEDMMEFRLSYEMWRVGHWVVSVPFAQKEEEELCFTVRIEERDNPENLHWDVQKTQTDIIHFRNLWQDLANLPSLSELEGNIEGDFQRATACIQHFLQLLVSDAQMGNKQAVFQFLCPLEKLLNEEECEGGVWSLFSGLAEFLTPAQEEDEERHNSLQRRTKSDDSSTTEVPDPTANENLHELVVSSKEGRAQGPLILITQWDDKSLLKLNSTECCENIKTIPVGKYDSLVNAEKTEGKTEKSENPMTFKRTTLQKGLSRSEDCLAQMKQDAPENQNVCTPQHGSSLYDLSDSLCHHLAGKSNKKERLTFKMSGGISKSKGKDVGSQSTLEDSHCLKKDPSSWEHIEATKAIFDLLKAISGNSIFMNIFDAILKPVMLILKKKVNSFLNKIRPTEAQIALYIDLLREKQWPEGLPKTNSPEAHRSSEEKNDTKDRAQQLINSRYTNYLILKKTDVESVFKLFQDREENKKLVYMLLSFILRKLLPDEDTLNMNAVSLQKVKAN